MARRAELWLLDEPHAGLDAAGRDELDATLRAAVDRRGDRDRRQPRAGARRRPGHRIVDIAGGLAAPEAGRHQPEESSSVSAFAVARLMAVKDLRIELRSRIVLNQVVPFALIVLVMFGFALDADAVLVAGSPPG